ncbi:MAG: AAA family ATPase, partial [Nitrospinae bacterium]|nr:AAA family ATPase [Nitrospinota bacterium]
MQIAEAAKLSRTILEALQQVIVGKERVLQHLLLGLFSGGKILIEDFPGLAKTLTARLIAQVTGLEFKRIQFTPDLLPGDITGGLIYNQKRGEFEFRPGPLFTNLVLADEVNRAPPKTQAALLEVMQERQVTIEGTTHPVPLPFVVLATQNPIELEGTYPLPEAQLDRFVMRLRVGYPGPEEERQILALRG